MSPCCNPDFPQAGVTLHTLAVCSMPTSLPYHGSLLQVYAAKNAGIVLLVTASSNEVRVWCATSSSKYFDHSMQQTTYELLY